MSEEGMGKLFEVTIKWRNIEWAFSCAESDYQGHATSQLSKHPHYHFQMRIDNRPVINYNDYHLPFSEMDIINIEAMRAGPEKIKQQFSFGPSMNDLLSDETVQHLVNTSVPPDMGDDLMLKFDAIEMADEGKAINGDDLNALIQEAETKGVTVVPLMHKLPNAWTQVIVAPGPNVVKPALRGGRKGGA